MSVITQKSLGKQGAIFLQTGVTSIAASPITCNYNATAVAVDGITYPAYSVWTAASGAPFAASRAPALTIGGSGLPSFYSWTTNYLLGKFLFTPSLGASATVAIPSSSMDTPNMYQSGDQTEWSLDISEDYTDVTGPFQNWKSTLSGHKSWKGSATVWYTSTNWWLGSAAGSGGRDDAIMLKLYPAYQTSTEYWYGMAHVTWGLKVPVTGGIAQTVTFNGTDALYYAAS